MKRGSKSPPPLKLQSYKVDSAQLQSKIYELDQLKSDLQSSIAKQQTHEDHRANEILTLKS